jgi:hypothetical protein
LTDTAPSGQTYSFGINQNSIEVSVNGTAASFTISSIANGCHIECSVSKDDLLAPGTNELRISVMDNVGNQREHTTYF